METCALMFSFFCWICKLLEFVLRIRLRVCQLFVGFLSMREAKRVVCTLILTINFQFTGIPGQRFGMTRWRSTDIFVAWSLFFTRQFPVSCTAVVCISLFLSFQKIHLQNIKNCTLSIIYNCYLCMSLPQSAHKFHVGLYFYPPLTHGQSRHGQQATFNLYGSDPESAQPYCGSFIRATLS